jgi:hypothetical protein
MHDDIAVSHGNAHAIYVADVANTVTHWAGWAFGELLPHLSLFAFVAAVDHDFGCDIVELSGEFTPKGSRSAGDKEMHCDCPLVVRLYTRTVPDDAVSVPILLAMSMIVAVWMLTGKLSIVNSF